MTNDKTFTFIWEPKGQNVKIYMEAPGENEEQAHAAIRDGFIRNAGRLYPAKRRQSKTTPKPCRSLPKKDWCDKDGPGGFMGHTCA